jgi:SIR2-like domain/TIR domain
MGDEVGPVDPALANSGRTVHNTAARTVSAENLQSLAGAPSSDGSLAAPLRVFVNYRHADTQGTAWALYFKLTEQFGEANVFFDNGSLRPGTQWLQEIKAHVHSAGVFIVLIGAQWTSTLTAHQQRGGEDYVAKEIDLALRNPRLTVLPVLVDEAQPPRADELPPMLRALPDRQVERLRHTHLQEDVAHLIAGLRSASPLPHADPAATPSAPLTHSPLPPSPLSPSPLTPAPLPPSSLGPRPPIVHPARRDRPSGEEPRRQFAPEPDEDHYRMIARQAGNLVVFLGAGANAENRDGPWLEGSGALPDDLDLAGYIAAKVQRQGAPADLAEVAQHASAMCGEQEVLQWVRQILRVESEPSQIHERLARLPARMQELGLEKRHQLIVTSNYDDGLERAFRAADEDFDVAVYMAPATEEAGRFVHLPWEANEPQSIPKPNDYYAFPINEDGRLTRTVIVRINGAVDDRALGYRWVNNYVITENHYIDYFGGHAAEEVVPAQILAKLRQASYLFLAYTMTDWRLRVFLQRIAQGQTLGRAKYWAIERDPDMLERELWQQAGASLYSASLSDYLQGLDDFLVAHAGELRA